MELTKEAEVAIAQKPLEVQLSEKFAIFRAQADEWLEKAKAIKVTDSSQTDLMKEARIARLELRKIRIAITDRHKDLKADALIYSQTLDKVKRTLVDMIEPIEAVLQESEDFEKTQEENRRVELFNKRAEILRPYIGDQVRMMALADLSDDVFENMVKGYKLTKEENDRKSANEKIEQEKKAKLQLRVNKISGLKFFFGNNQTEVYTHACGATISLHNVLNQTDDEFEAFVHVAKIEIVKYDAAELKKKQKIEKEEQDKKDETARKRKASRAPDEEKLAIFANELDELARGESVQITLPKVKDTDAQKIVNDVSQLLKKIQKHINDKIKTL